MAESDFLRAAFGPSPDCLSVETLDALANSRLERAARANAERHLAACAHCRNEAALLAQFHSSEPRPEERADLAWIEGRLRGERPVPAPERWSFAAWLREAFAVRRWQTLSIAAACLLFLVAGGFYLRNGREPAIPSLGGEPVWRSAQLTAIAPVGDLDTAPAELKWESVPGATRYTVRVLQVDRTEIWKAESAVSSIELPNNVRQQMSPGRGFLWSVTAENGSAHTIAESALQTFHISMTSK